MHKKYGGGFTIVELLVVIVVIGILAAITIVSYSGISNKAIVASLQTDLDSNNKQLRMYNVEYGYYPSAIDPVSYCPTTPTADTRYCLKASPDTTLVYTGSNQTFSLRATRNSITYEISDGNSVASLFTQTAPVVSLNTSIGIGTTFATLGASVTSDGGSTVTSVGTCWGPAINPSTNCSSINYGALTPYSTAKIAVAGSYPANVAVSPDDKYVYVNNEGGATISMFSRNVSNGSLAPLSPATIAAGHGAHGMVFSPDGNYLYVSSCDTHTISMYSRSTDTGLLAPLSPATIATGSSPYGLAISPDGKSLYTGNEQSDNISIFTRSDSTGLLTSNGVIAAGDRAHFPVISPDGKSVYVTNYDANTLSSYTRDTVTGALSVLGSVIPTGTNPQISAISPDGKSLYVGDGDGKIEIYDRDLITGALTAAAIPTINDGTSGNYFIVISSDGKSLYSANLSPNTISIFNRNTSDGVLTAASPATISSTRPFGLALSADQKSLYATDFYNNYVFMFRRNTNSGDFIQYRNGLNSNTLVHYRGFATNGIGTSYSADSTFNTLP